MLPHDIFQPLGRYFLCIQMKFGRQDDFFTKCLYSQGRGFVRKSSPLGFCNQPE